MPSTKPWFKEVTRPQAGAKSKQSAPSRGLSSLGAPRESVFAPIWLTLDLLALRGNKALQLLADRIWHQDSFDPTCLPRQDFDGAFGQAS